MHMQKITVCHCVILGIPTISQSVAFPVPCCGSLPLCLTRCDPLRRRGVTWVVPCVPLCPHLVSPLWSPEWRTWWSRRAAVTWTGWPPLCCVVVGCSLWSPWGGVFVLLCCLCCFCVFFRYVVWKFQVYKLEVGLLNFFGFLWIDCCCVFVIVVVLSWFLWFLLFVLFCVFFRYVVWKFPVCKLEVGLLNLFWVCFRWKFPNKKDQWLGS